MCPQASLSFPHLFIYCSDIYWAPTKCQEPGCVLRYKEKSPIYIWSPLSENSSSSQVSGRLCWVRVLCKLKRRHIKEASGTRWLPHVLLFCVIQPSPEKLQAHVSILCSCVLVCGYDGLVPGDSGRSRHPRLIQPGQQQCGCRPPGAALHRPQCILGCTSFLPGRQGKAPDRAFSITAWASFPVWKEASGSSGYYNRRS